MWSSPSDSAMPCVAARSAPRLAESWTQETECASVCHSACILLMPNVYTVSGWSRANAIVLKRPTAHHCSSCSALLDRPDFMYSSWSPCSSTYNMLPTYADRCFTRCLMHLPQGTNILTDGLIFGRNASHCSPVSSKTAESRMTSTSALDCHELASTTGATCKHT